MRSLSTTSNCVCPNRQTHHHHAHFIFVTVFWQSDNSEQLVPAWRWSSGWLVGLSTRVSEPTRKLEIDLIFFLLQGCLAQNDFEPPPTAPVPPPSSSLKKHLAPHLRQHHLHRRHSSSSSCAPRRPPPQTPSPPARSRPDFDLISEVFFFIGPPHKISSMKKLILSYEMWQ